MASRGSVIPLFYNQIKNKSAITITDPDMTRFMMTLDDAVELVIYAFKSGKPGDIFVKKSPSSTIEQIANALKKIYNSNVKIDNIGVRHGEKKHETLLSREELTSSQDLGEYFKIPADNRDLNYEKYFSKGKQIKNIEDYNSFNTERLSESDLVTLLNSIGYKNNLMKSKLVTFIGTRPEIIKLSCVIKKCDDFFDHIIVHTGQNYDYELNEIFFEDLGIRKPDYFLNVKSDNLGNSIGNIISKSYEILQKIIPDAFLILGDTNSCLSAISAKRLKIPIFHMEAGNRCFDQNVPEEINRKIVDHISDINMPYTENARKYLLAEGIRGDFIFNIGSPMKEIIHSHTDSINKSKILKKLNLNKQEYIVVSVHREENVDNKSNLLNILESLESIYNKYKRRIIFSTHPRTKNKLKDLSKDFSKVINFIKPLGFLIIYIFKQILL